MSFATELEKHVERLGIAGVLAAFEAAGDAITRKTLENWRYKEAPRVVIQRGALAILSEARPKTKKAAPGRSNNSGQTTPASVPKSNE